MVAPKPDLGAFLRSHVARSLVGEEHEELFLHDGTAQRAAEQVLVGEPGHVERSSYHQSGGCHGQTRSRRREGRCVPLLKVSLTVMPELRLNSGLRVLEIKFT